MRAIVTVADGRVQVRSRNNRDFTAHYPELQALAGATRRKGLVLDGEIIAPGPDGRPSFELLATRIPSRPSVCGTSINLMLFDVLGMNGQYTMKKPYTERRRMLEELRLDGPNWKTLPNFIGEGEHIRAVSRQHRLDGVVAKRLDSVYEPGKRSGARLKIKNHHTSVFRIGG
jgi:bifunctional non-homologous end joining protein LigD